jgi:cell division septum initiation protein DivIVA
MSLAVTEDLASEIKQLQKRIQELEQMLSQVLSPLQMVQQTTQKYLNIVQLLLNHGGLTPDLILPDLKDSISRDIVRVLLEHSDLNVSQITDLVKTKRGTASRRIIREKIQTLTEKNIIEKQQKESRYVYRLSAEVIKKWSQLLGIPI